MDALQSAAKQYLTALNQTTNISTKEETVIETNIYTQSKKRFILGCFWEVFVCVVFIGALIVSIGCLATANQEADDGEWLQILTGVLILIVVLPLLIALAVYLPHFFISAVTLTDSEILVPRSILLLRAWVSYYDITQITVDVSGAVTIFGQNSKYQLSNHIEGLSQVLWYIHTKNPDIKCDEFVLKRIDRWENSRGSESDALL